MATLGEEFLPTDRKDMAKRGWDEVDFALITGDTYVDHPSFGAAIISRVLEAGGYKVGIIAQPDWRRREAFQELGRPRLGFLVTAGNIDSMVAHYTAAKRRRKEDEYSPGGKPGLRPDRATIVYTNRLREIYGDIPVILGGIEASMRRLAHYDYWDDKVRKAILLDAGANLLVYGMGEKAIGEIADALQGGVAVADINWVRGTCYKTAKLDQLTDYAIIPGYEEIADSKKKYAAAFRRQAAENDPVRGKALVQYQGNVFVVQNPPAIPLTTEEIDRIYDLPYTRRYHPVYERAGGVPAIREVEFSLVSHRGCFGSCAFCAIAFHQGSIIQNRSQAGILAEAELLTRLPGFKGYIHDLGGPTANMYMMGCEPSRNSGHCQNRECLFPQPCRHLNTNHQPAVELLEKVRELPGVKKVFVRSGVRYDLLLADRSETYLVNLCAHHVSGQLKVAPEHAAKQVTDLMRKPGRELFDQFAARYRKLNEALLKKQYLVPYFIASHPGSRLEDAVELAEYIRDLGHYSEQVQDFTPTPGTLATAMYYTEQDPLTGEPVYVPRSEAEREMQRALLQFNNPRNYRLVRQALRQVGREDLIGSGKKCLVPADPAEKNAGTANTTRRQTGQPRNAGPSRRPRKPGKTGRRRS
ncbi:MAG: YgiQ family radical SAM protein [bacterium]|jgi:uncharacterized radical SAM protein YgiQ